MTIINETLTTNGVSILSDKYGTRAYENSEYGRTKLILECDEEVATIVLDVWGNEPSIYQFDE